MYFAPRGTICAKAQNFLLILPIESGIINIVQKTIRRCVGMADEGDSKSLVLITRVGSTPTTGIKKEPSSLSGGFLFYLRRVRGSNSTALPRRASDMQFADFAYTLKRETAAPCFLCRSFCFLFTARPACAGSTVPPYSAPAAGRFCPPYLLPQRRPAFRDRSPVLPEGRTIPDKTPPKRCSGHLFCCFLPILQCFL